MVRLNSDSIENFIRENRDKFGVYPPPDNHWNRFLFKLNFNIGHIISIVPYLMRVAIFTFIVFFVSIIAWNKYIRKDRHELTLKDKITLVVDKMF